MRRARGLRISSSRDLCIFCATRQVAPRDAALTSSPAILQRRHLNSSSKAPQYATEAQIYREDSQPARSLTQAEKMRQRLMASRPVMPSSPQVAARRSSANDRSWVATPNRQPDRPPQRPPMNSFNRPGRNQSSNRYVPPSRDSQAPQSRYKVDMGARPPLADIPQFGSAPHLRRRSDQSSSTGPVDMGQRPGPRQAPRSSGNQGWDRAGTASFLDDLSSTKRDAPRPAPRLSRATEPKKCFNCGQEGHQSFDCPDKSRVRQPRPFDRTQKAPTTASLEGDTNTWTQKNETTFGESSAPEISVNDVDQRRQNETLERRRRRFALDNESTAPAEIRNRFEEPQRRGRNTDRRARGRVMRDEDEQEEGLERAERKRRRKEAKKAAQLVKGEPTPIHLPAYVSVANLASMLKLRVEDFVRKLEELGFEEVQNDHILNAEHAGLIAQEYNFEPIFQAETEDQDLYPAPAPSAEEYTMLPTRPPVVTIMGHVDHGKTTILDYMRNSSVAAGEFGGITQHIGAFSVPLASGKTITFLDTPGHAAFETMRARGANVTDIVVLVVAADDSVMPQTVEAIKHAQAAKVPMIVAINKIDRQQADPDNVKLDLGRHGLEVEDFGGDIQTVLVSGKTGQGIPDLEEAITTQSEILDHRADPHASVEGWVLEGTTKKNGKVATILIRSGTLRSGHSLVAGKTWTRIKTLRNENGVVVDEVGPGMPVEVDGWREQPIAGDEVLQAEDDQHASEVAELRTDKLDRAKMAEDMDAINESRRRETERREAEEAAEKASEADETGPASEEVKKESGPETVNFIVKGDVSGSVEAVIDSIAAVGNAEVATRVLRHGVGPPSEFDVQHAADASGHIVNFNTVVSPTIATMAEREGVRILDSNIIYRVVENVKELLSEKLAPKVTHRVTGEVEIAAAFEIDLGRKKTMKIAGSKVRNGHVNKGTKAKVLRRDEVIFTGVISSLKSQKKDVDQMRKDTECGIGFEGWDDFKIGDKIQCFEEIFEKRKL